MSDDVKVVSTFGQDMMAYGWLTWAWVGLISVVGGVVNFAGKVKQGTVRWVNITELMGELFISGFVGFCTFLLADGHLPKAVVAVLIAISSHMGTRAIYMFEQYFAKKLLLAGVDTAEDVSPTLPSGKP